MSSGLCQWLSGAKEHIWHEWSITFTHTYSAQGTHMAGTTNQNKSTLSLHSNSWSTKVYPSNEEGTTERLCDMLSGECTMRDVFLEQSCFWEVHSGEDVARDHVKEIHQVKEELLPEKSFQILDAETASYAEKIRCEKGGVV